MSIADLDENKAALRLGVMVFGTILLSALMIAKFIYGLIMHFAAIG